MSRQSDWLEDLTGPQIQALLARTPKLHEHQTPPDEAWRTWVLLGGRGSGKTFAGAYWLNGLARTPGLTLALVGPALHDVREVMVEGPSGLKETSPKDERPRWEAGRKRLIWPNKTVAYAFSAEDPDSLRGPQFHGAWADEFCAWRTPEKTLSNLRFGLRLGGDPRLMVTTTPRPMGALRRLLSVWAGGDMEALSLRATALAPATIGVLAEELAPGIVGRWDEVNAILVDVEGAAPSSLSGGAVLAGANAVAIQTASGWEVVQFRRATLVGAGRWRLAGLLRAQQGTQFEMAAGGQVGGVVVFLDENLVRAEVAASEYGLPMVWSAGPRGGPAGGVGVTRRDLALTGVHRRPFSPAHLKVSVEAGGRRIQWIARARTGGDVWEGEPSASDPMRFRIRVRDGEVVRREFDVEGTESLYADADRAADFPSGLGLQAWVDVAQADGRMGWGAYATMRLLA